MLSNRSMRERPKPIRHGQRSCLMRHRIRSPPLDAITSLRSEAGSTKRFFSPRSEKPLPLYLIGLSATAPLTPLDPHFHRQSPPDRTRANTRTVTPDQGMHFGLILRWTRYLSRAFAV